MIPIVIDNGSYQIRVGFAGDSIPSLVCRNHIAKLRRDKGKKEVDILVGNEIENLDNLRYALKSQFDKNVVVCMDIQENVFDYVFSKLNIQSEDKLENPVVVNEAFLNPNYCRYLMSELLFECYQAPSVAYGIDCISSLSKNVPGANDSLIISLGYKAIHIIPMLNGQIDPRNSKRINLGGCEVTLFLFKLLQLKYPSHLTTLTVGKIEEILHSDCSISTDYFEDLEQWSKINYYNDNVLKIEAKKPSGYRSQEQSDSIKEKRKENAKKLTQINTRKRLEKLAEDEERLEILNEINDSVKEEEKPGEVQRALQAASCSCINELLKQIDLLKSRIAKTKEKANTSITSVTTSPPLNSTNSRNGKKELSPDITDLFQKRTELLRKRSLRRQKRSDMVKRRSLASQERMRILSQLAKQEKDDNFGSNDDDWDVYKAIQKDGDDSESEDEKEELTELEDVLKTHDPTFLINQGLVTGADENELHIGLEKIRAPELIFQPSMVGEPFMGLAESINQVIKLYPEDVQNRLVSTVFLSGGLISLKGIIPRLRKEIMEMRPFESSFNIVVANDPVLDGWKGLSDWAANKHNQDTFFLTKSAYDEMGGDYFKEHSLSNKYFPTPDHSESMLS